MYLPEQDASNIDKWYPVYSHGTMMQLVEGLLNQGVHRAPVMNEENIFQQIITQVLASCQWIFTNLS